MINYIVQKEKYKETQRSRKTEVWILVVIFLGLVVYNALRDLPYQQDTGKLAFTFTTYLVIILAAVALLWYYNSIQFTLTINEKGIRYKYFPWHSRKERIKWEDIAAYELVKTPKWGAMSGWNVSYDLRETVYTCSGYNGLRIHLKNGRTIFLGTQHFDELEKFMSEWNIPNVTQA